MANNNTTNEEERRPPRLLQPPELRGFSENELIIPGFVPRLWEHQFGGVKFLTRKTSLILPNVYNNSEEARGFYRTKADELVLHVFKEPVEPGKLEAASPFDNSITKYWMSVSMGSPGISGGKLRVMIPYVDPMGRTVQNRWVWTGEYYWKPTESLIEEIMAERIPKGVFTKTPGFKEHHMCDGLNCTSSECGTGYSPTIHLEFCPNCIEMMVAYLAMKRLLKPMLLEVWKRKRKKMP